MVLTDVFLGRPDLLADGTKLKSALADFYFGDTPRINRMMKAYELGIIDALSAGKNIDLEKQKLINQLVNLHDMQDVKAKEAVNEWSKVCTPKVINRYQEYIRAEKERQEKIAEAENAKKQHIESTKEKKKKDQELAAKKAGELNDNFDDYGRYYNLDLTKGDVVYGIPCGVGKSDYGFIVKGTGYGDPNDHALFPSRS